MQPIANTTGPSNDVPTCYLYLWTTCHFSSKWGTTKTVGNADLKTVKEGLH